jgi:paraquat-inducible protein B
MSADATNEPTPTAHVVRRSRLGLAWITPLATLGVMGWLGYDVWRAQPVRARVQFAQGNGLEAGSPVRYRGIVIGEVEQVVLVEEPEGIEARFAVSQDAAGLLRAGTRLWVPEPRISIAGVTDLDALLGPSTLVLDPGPEGGEPLLRFVGEDAPPVKLPFENGLEFTLEAARRGGLTAGAPVLFRELPVGRVTGVELASDASSVELGLLIDPRFAELVREGTRFWRAYGLELNFDLISGLELNFDSLEGLITGAVAFATPPDAGEAAPAGTRFELSDGPQESWLGWRPSLPVGADEALAERRPEPRRAVLRWEPDRIFAGQQERSGWALRLDDSLVGPRDLLVTPEDAKVQTIELVVGGQSLPSAPDLGEPGAPAMVERLRMDLDTEAWPSTRVRRPVEPEDCLVVLDARRGPSAIGATRLTPLTGDQRPASGAWAIDGRVSFEAEWHGAAVLSREDGALIGILILDDERAWVGLIPERAR